MQRRHSRRCPGGYPSSLIVHPPMLHLPCIKVHYSTACNKGCATRDRLWWRGHSQPSLTPWMRKAGSAPCGLGHAPVQPTDAQPTGEAGREAGLARRAERQKGRGGLGSKLAVLCKARRHLLPAASPGRGPAGHALKRCMAAGNPPNQRAPLLTAHGGTAAALLSCCTLAPAAAGLSWPHDVRAALRVPGGGCRPRHRTGSVHPGLGQRREPAGST